MATIAYQPEKPYKPDAKAKGQKRDGPALDQRIEYPTGDGKPMAETDWHLLVMTVVIAILKRWFAGKSEVYVAGNMLMYYEPGNKRKHVSPDVFVVFGVSKKLRGCFLVWEEGKAPSVVIEITSKSTKKEDKTTKMALYRDVLKVEEYFLFDPLGEYLKPQLQGFRLRQGDYVAIDEIENRLPSAMLGLHLEADGTNLRLHDPAADAWLPTLEEQIDLTTGRAERAEGRASQAEERVSHLESELQALRRALQKLQEQTDQE